MCAHSLDYGNVLLGFFSLFFSLLFVYFGVLLFRRAFMIRRLSITPVNRVRDGFVKVYGIVSAANGTLLGPLSGKNCVYYEYLIEESRGGTDVYSTVKSDKSIVCFYLDDGTGRVLINPECALVDLSEDYKFHSGVFKDPPGNVLRFLSENNIKHDGAFGLNKGMKFYEYCIEPGNKLYVIGTARKNLGGPLHGYASRDEYVIGPAKGSLFYIADMPEKKVIYKTFKNAFEALGIGVFMLFVSAFVLALGLGLT
jgi:hypothetical protein